VLTQRAAPGMLYSYSNINFCLAQLVIEKATGQKYTDYVQAKIAQPTGIKSWQFATLRGKDDEPDYVTQSGEKGSPYTGLDFESLGGAGAWTSTAADYLRFVVALRAQGREPLLTPASFNQLIAAPALVVEGRATHYGLGANVRRFDNGRFTFWHHGSLAGTSSVVLSYASGWAVVAIFNSRLRFEERTRAAADTESAIGQAVAKSKPPAADLGTALSP
jgi:D-alanyl-D-alanine carboxypeptidase